MKILKTLCLLAFAAVMPAMLTSCDDDDDEPSSSASSSSSSYSGPAFGLRDCGKVISRIQGVGLFGDKPLSFVYDESGRVVEVKVGSLGTVSYDYNSQTGKVVNGFIGKSEFDADANGRFNSLTRVNSWGKTDFEFKYNSDGNVIQVVGRRYYEQSYGIDDWCGTCTFIWDGDLLTSVRITLDDDIADDYELKITYSDVDNKYRIPLYGLNVALFYTDLYPNELSIAPAKLPKKIEYYVRGEEEDEFECRYTLDDEGFIESEYIEVNADGEDNVYIRYTYADKEF